MVWAVLTGCVVPCGAQPGAGVLTVEVGPAEVTVGDRVEARLELEWSGPTPAAAPRFPVWGERWGGAEVLEAGEVEAVPGRDARRLYRQTVMLTAFRPGRVELPPVAVAVPLETGTVEVRLDAGAGAGFEVRSVLPEDADGLAPRPPAPLQALAPGAGWWTAGTLAAAVLVLAAWLARRLHGARHGAARPLLEPLEELLEKLRRLDPRSGEVTHTALSFGLRRFLARSLGLRAVEGTTSEIQRRLRTAPVEAGAARRTVHLLRDCDRVKFARLEVSAARTRDRLREARDLAREIDGGLRPLEEEAAAG